MEGKVVHMRSCTCPNCKANLSIDDDNRDYAFCQYCGTKIMLDDYRSTYRYVDEAELKHAETEQILKLKKLEIAEKNRERKNKNACFLMKTGMIMFIAGVGLSYFADFFVGIRILGFFAAFLGFIMWFVNTF